MTSNDSLAELARVLQSRKGGDPASSYVARLLHQGPDAFLKKIGEEATETIIAAKSGERSALVYETADLIFHTLVLLGHQNIPLQDVLNELARREGLSGIAEKNARAEK